MSIFRKLLKYIKNYTILDENGKPYLTRYYLTPDKEWWRKRFPGIFIHDVHQSDNDRETHSHPWSWSYSLILDQGYKETRLVDGIWDEVSKTLFDCKKEERTFTPGSINAIWHNTFHKIELLNPDKGCLTLFIAGPRVDLPEKENWGFINDNGKNWESHYERAERKKREKLLKNEETNSRKQQERK